MVDNLNRATNLPWDFMTLWRKLLEELMALEWWKIKFCRTENRVTDSSAKVGNPVFTIFRMYLLPSVEWIYLPEKKECFGKVFLVRLCP